MKKQKLFAVIIAALLLTGCTQNAADTSEDTSVTASETSAQTSASISETKSETSEEIITETEAAEKNDTGPEYVEVSIGNEFIDYEFVENYQGTTDIGDLANKAVDFLKTTDEYAESMKNISEFSDDEFFDYIKNGEIVPKFSIAYPNDYDGDGRTETFIAVNMPAHYGYVSNTIASFYIYADCAENMTMLDVWGNADESVTFLNYGRDKQIAFGGGFSPYGSITYLYGVKYGEPVLLYSKQEGLEKRACFLKSHGFQASECFMYYDTAAREYRNIAAEKVSHDELKALDTSGSLNSVFEEHGDRFSAWIVGGKYYCIKVMFEFANVYTYDNGTFTLMNDPIAGLSIPISSEPCVKDIDIDSAVAEMKPPAEPYTTVSPDNEFIDYNFIANYPGTTDIGDLADKAVEFLKTTEDYSDSTENYSMFTEEGIRNKYKDYTYVRIDGTVDDSSREKDILEEIEYFSEYLDEKGSIVPKLDTAYPGDYDGDGKEEVFIVINMPIAQGDRGIIRSFLIFSGSDGKMQLLDNFSGAYPTVLLDYGICRHIAIGGYGTVGADDHTHLYGVRNGKAEVLYYGRCSFYKEDCFLAIYGWQGSGCFMYFDTAAREYRAIDSVYVSLEEIRKMDNDNVMAEYYEWYEEKGYVFFNLIGGKYYCASLGPMDTGEIYTYENGRFVPQEDCRARCSDYFDGSDGSTVTDMDIDRALSQMKPITEPFSPITKGSTPINFEYIENYQSAADTDRYAEALQKYVNESFAFSSTTDEVCEAAEKDFPDYTDNNGSLIPKILAAYPNDYDGDGREEAFVVFEIPFNTYNNEEPFGLKSFLLFIDDDDEEKWLTYYSRYPVSADNVVLLDYGSKKHLLFIGEEESDTKLYGVKNGYVKEYFSGTDCTVKKNGCLLDISYGAGGGCTLYYDNIADDYLTLSGRNLFDGSSMPSPISVSGE